MKKLPRNPVLLTRSTHSPAFSREHLLGSWGDFNLINSPCSGLKINIKIQ